MGFRLESAPSEDHDHGIEDHAASRRVLEKCGMEVVGHVSETWKKFEEPVKLALYGVTRGKWGRHSS